jgi:hypothetical protein
MKRTIIAALFLALAAGMNAQQETASEEKKQDREFQTLLGHNRSGGMYGSFSVGYSKIDDDQAVLFGGRLMWVVSHSIGFGFGGTGFINEYHYDPILMEDVFLTGGYGGLYIEPILAPKFPVHLSFPILLGGGGISYVTKDMDNYDNFIEDTEAFLIAEPGVELELNVTRNFRFSVGATYRFTSEFEVGNNPSPAVDSDALKGFSYMATFKFGRF